MTPVSWKSNNSDLELYPNGVIRPYEPNFWETFRESSFQNRLVYDFLDMFWVYGTGAFSESGASHLVGGSASGSELQDAAIGTIVTLSPLSWASGSLSAESSIASSGGRAFFSGAGTESQALSKGFTTIGQTRAGQNLMALTKDMPYFPGSQAYEMWGRLSTQWAKGASGEVHVFQNAATGVDLQSIWRIYEYPALRANPNVTNIFFHY